MKKILYRETRKAGESRKARRVKGFVHHRGTEGMEKARAGIRGCSERKASQL